MVQVQLSEVDSLIEVADDLHVLQLSHNWVLESLLEQVIVGLFELALSCSLLLLTLMCQKEAVASLSKIILLNFLLGLLTAAVLVNISNMSSDFTLDLLQGQSLLILLLAKLLVRNALLRALLNDAVLLELLDFTPRNLELLNVLGLGSGETLVSISLPLFEVLFEPVEVNRVLNDHALEGSLLIVLLSELALHIFEERARADLDISDLDCGEMDTPASDDGGHLLHDSLTKGLPVLDDVVDR